MPGCGGLQLGAAIGPLQYLAVVDCNWELPLGHFSNITASCSQFIISRKLCLQILIGWIVVIKEYTNYLEFKIFTSLLRDNHLMHSSLLLWISLFISFRVKISSIRISLYFPWIISHWLQEYFLICWSPTPGSRRIPILGSWSFNIIVAGKLWVTPCYVNSPPSRWMSSDLFSRPFPLKFKSDSNLILFRWENQQKLFICV